MSDNHPLFLLYDGKIFFHF